MSLVRFDVEGTPDEVIAHLEELMTPGRYFVKVSRKIEDLGPAAEDGLLTADQDFDQIPQEIGPGQQVASTDVPGGTP